MSFELLLYGATGFVGEAIARLAVAHALRPLSAGRDRGRLAAELGVEHRAFALDDADEVDATLAEVRLVLRCAGPFLHTSEAMVGRCLRTNTHYRDITGEVPVYEAISERDAEAQARHVRPPRNIGPCPCTAVQVRCGAVGARAIPPSKAVMGSWLDGRDGPVIVSLAAFAPPATAGSGTTGSVLH